MSLSGQGGETSTFTNHIEFQGDYMRIPSFYSFVKRIVGKLDEKLAIRILCLFVR
jgi:hypothetical protein